MAHVVLGKIGESFLLKRDTDFEPYIVAIGYDIDSGSWLQGNYFGTLQDASVYALSQLGRNTPITAHMGQLKSNYNIACTAEFLRDNFNVSDEDAWIWASDVREKMEDDDEYNNIEVSIIEETKGDWV